jgi:ABC-type Zn2+ transport system substrate-binding protein/surface adhesin
MSEEKKPEVEETSEEQTKECCQGHEEHENEDYRHHGPWSHHQGLWMRRRMMMHFASMTIEEEVEFLENVKARLEDRLSVVNERLAKLKA